jgi:hypothetical protein
MRTKGLLSGERWKSLSPPSFKELSENCDALCRFGDDHTILQKIARGRIAG